MFSKSLILFNAEDCSDKGQCSRKPEESRLWLALAQFAHKVVHRNCGQRKNDFPIIDLASIPNSKPSFAAQVHGEKW